MSGKSMAGLRRWPRLAIQLVKLLMNDSRAKLSGKLVCGAGSSVVSRDSEDALQLAASSCKRSLTDVPSLGAARR